MLGRCGAASERPLEGVVEDPTGLKPGGGFPLMPCVESSNDY